MMKDLDDLRRQGVYQVVTPDECIEMAGRTEMLVLKPLVGGMTPDIGWGACGSSPRRSYQSFVYQPGDTALPRKHLGSFGSRINPGPAPLGSLDRALR